VHNTIGNSKTQQKGLVAPKAFTLIELLVVIAIVGILATLAIPYYEGHKISAKLTEVENTMMVVKSAVSNFRQEREEWPNCPSTTEVLNSLGVGLGSISRISALSVVNGVITATVNNIHPMVDSKTLSLTPTLNPDGSIRWTWGWSADFPLHLRPKGS